MFNRAPMQNMCALKLFMIHYRCPAKRVNGITGPMLKGCGLMNAATNEYGFYANVNPQVDHPRWSQASERRIGELSRRPTLMYNGYEEEVAHLYDGMDLQENF